MVEEFPRPTRSLKGRTAIVSINLLTMQIREYTTNTNLKVTGAGAAGDGIGNGRAAAILLAEAGCSVVCVDLKLDLAQRTVEFIEEDGLGEAVAVEANVTKEDECKRIVNTAVEKYGRLDILVNVVGVGGATGTAVEVDMVEWAKGMEINVGSMVSLQCKF